MSLLESAVQGTGKPPLLAVAREIRENIYRHLVADDIVDITADAATKSKRYGYEPERFSWDTPKTLLIFEDLLLASTQLQEECTEYIQTH
ncbi:hypothetical protein PMZ80_009024 [Knufia obscura]|uniref:Uncharacterized protein n=1 Tax=Knufia obscura TaxID=1635080 RepID=A0ABR0RDY8_9EURO|nr:hypothetical protein PMZ80_009024 [Knufia obscura]